MDKQNVVNLAMQYHCSRKKTNQTADGELSEHPKHAKTVKPYMINCNEVSRKGKL